MGARRPPKHLWFNLPQACSVFDGFSLDLLSKQTGTPMWNALKRIRYTTTQTKLDRSERMENLRGAFRVRHTRRVKGRHLILVDDVFTTGSTVEECSRVLLRAGAASVRVITVARG